ncbi:MAG: hypothetical protein AAFZ18_11255 [Myxococcota bacterium]
MAFVDLNRNRLVLKSLIAGPPAVGKSERLWQLGHASGTRRVQEFGQTPLGPQRMASFDLDVQREGRPVEIEVYEWHGPERADIRGKGLFSGLDGFIYLADARADRTVDSVQQLRFLVQQAGRSKLKRIPSLLALGRMDDGLARLSTLEPQLEPFAWGQRLETPLDDTEAFVEASHLLGETMLMRLA